jgi:hypothetical protein
MQSWIHLPLLVGSCIIGLHGEWQRTISVLAYHGQLVRREPYVQCVSNEIMRVIFVIVDLQGAPGGGYLIRGGVDERNLR